MFQGAAEKEVGEEKHTDRGAPVGKSKRVSIKQNLAPLNSPFSSHSEPSLVKAVQCIFRRDTQEPRVQISAFTDQKGVFLFSLQTQRTKHKMSCERQNKELLNAGGLVETGYQC